MYFSIITDLKKSATTIFIKIHLLHLGIVHTDWLIYFFQTQNLVKIILLLFDSSKSDPLYNRFYQMAHEA